MSHLNNFVAAVPLEKRYYMLDLPLLFGYEIDVQLDFGEALHNVISNYLIADNKLFKEINSAISFMISVVCTNFDESLTNVGSSEHLTLDISINEEDNLNDSICRYFGEYDLDFSQPDLHVSLEDKKNYVIRQELLINKPLFFLINLERCVFIDEHRVKLLNLFTFEDIFDIAFLLSTVNGSVLPLETTNYILKGIIVYSGISPESGHYYSFYVHNEQWFEFNDQNIRKVDCEYVKQKY